MKSVFLAGIFSTVALSAVTAAQAQTKTQTLPSQPAPPPAAALSCVKVGSDTFCPGNLKLDFQGAAPVPARPNNVQGPQLNVARPDDDASSGFMGGLIQRRTIDVYSACENRGQTGCLDVDLKAQKGVMLRGRIRF